MTWPWAMDTLWGHVRIIREVWLRIHRRPLGIEDIFLCQTNILNTFSTERGSFQRHRKILVILVGDFSSTDWFYTKIMWFVVTIENFDLFCDRRRYLLMIVSHKMKCAFTFCSFICKPASQHKRDYSEKNNFSGGKYEQVEVFTPLQCAQVAWPTQITSINCICSIETFLSCWGFLGQFQPCWPISAIFGQFFRISWAFFWILCILPISIFLDFLIFFE